MCLFGVFQTFKSLTLLNTYQIYLPGPDLFHEMHVSLKLGKSKLGNIDNKNLAMLMNINLVMLQSIKFEKHFLNSTTDTQS